MSEGEIEVLVRGALKSWTALELAVHHGFTQSAELKYEELALNITGNIRAKLGHHFIHYSDQFFKVSVSVIEFWAQNSINNPVRLAILQK